jgi:tRNA nucleotidyltransferase (CCA-adding enzyme)
MREPPLPDFPSLGQQLQKHLPPALWEFLLLAGREAASRGLRAFLVGGPVRDLLLGVKTLDLDIAVEGETRELVAALATHTGGRVLSHPRFSTATLSWGDYRVDFARTRMERYPRPGALPTVSPGTIEQDLARRDFTINAIALELTVPYVRQLLDPFRGHWDLDRKRLRVLHDASFMDDATRILRAIRYEQRFGFHLERHTLALLRRDLPYLATVSGDRLRHEVERIFQEAHPERALERGDRLEVWQHMVPRFTLGQRTEELFQRLRQKRVHASWGERARKELSWALLCLHLPRTVAQAVIDRLRIPSKSAASILEALDLQSKTSLLSRPDLRSSELYHLLEGYQPASLWAFALGTQGSIAARHVRTYLFDLRTTRPSLTGTDLTHLGVPRGPEMGQVLRRLLDLRLDGLVRSREEEERWVLRWLKGNARRANT